MSVSSMERRGEFMSLDMVSMKVDSLRNKGFPDELLNIAVGIDQDLDQVPEVSRRSEKYYKIVKKFVGLLLEEISYAHGDRIFHTSDWKVGQVLNIASIVEVVKKYLTMLPPEHQNPHVFPTLSSLERRIKELQARKSGDQKGNKPAGEESFMYGMTRRAYELLGLDVGVVYTEDEVRRIKNKLIFESGAHPDLGGSEGKAKAINGAFEEVLTYLRGKK